MKVFSLVRRSYDLLLFVGVLFLSGFGFVNQAEPLELYLPFPEDLKSAEINQTAVIDKVESSNQQDSNKRQSSNKEQDISA
ncbi:MAG: hypothetical protein MUF77_03965, partial [Leptospira sp.]|nr:hypothetical protein [Leptospira sp.]